MKRIWLMAAAAATAPTALHADEGTAAAATAASSVPARVIARAADRLPALLTPAERERYSAAYRAIDEQRWAEAQALLDGAPGGLLTLAAKAELYTAAGSPRVELPQLMEVLSGAPQLPQAQQLARLAASRGGTAMPALPGEHRLTWLGSAPIRARATPQRLDAAGTALMTAINPLIVDNRPADAEALVTAATGTVTPEAMTEARQRVAWSYYITGDDLNARRVASGAVSGIGRGEWAVQADWVLGLAAWRQNDWTAAANAFTAVSRAGEDAEMRAAGHYWAARADMAGGRPQQVEPRLRVAAQSPETFYGLIAAQALGMTQLAVDRALEFGQADRARLESCINSRIAIALVEIGQDRRAGAVLQHQARIGASAEHASLLRLARQLDLAETQLWLAHNGPQGARPALAARYPAPAWTPEGGWRVDRSLVYAHALQESRFRTDVTSPAGAQGLLQVRPGTAGDIARARGRTIAPAQLFVPATNMEYGQSYIERLRDMRATGGLLPKVIAAYNAGPAPVETWNTRNFDRGDPLLYIESLPYWETRGYVPIVLRNYWMYQRQAGEASGSLKAIAEGAWPRFPGSPGAQSVRLNQGGPARMASAD
ncbi:soluble lytic murein transglycosylase-like protein [Sphingomonas jejuensis]|uniref:Soluble lytic murein transglycosylase-like protein n=1 Tax=Sphingomonas jejuensis TaxID=904715 RepID=A0ABX0XLI6_9SPHN|nr:lytic transglycosylase domain-containing protein [Sphingomonas jejuensis]NJC33647.1 soluble lytic murein transglycosylase-like protein [Sphingomonas jejuensis]